MAALFLQEADVARLLDMHTAIACVETAFRDWAPGKAQNQPRRRVAASGGMLHAMTAASDSLGLLAFKVYTTTRTNARFLVGLADSQTGEWLAVMEADRLGQIRTGAASGVATKFLARSNSETVGCLGTGWQAESQLQAMCAVRPIRSITVFSRNRDRSDEFARRMTSLLGIQVESAETPEVAVRDRDIVITATSSRTPVLKGDWISPGTHLNVVGSNHLSKAEVDETTIVTADRIVCDSIEACQLEAGDFVPAIAAGQFRWEHACELREIVAESVPARTSEFEVTLFKSVGLALEDLAVAAEVFRRAKDAKIGVPLTW